MAKDKELYSRLKDAGCELDRHESDLYVLDTVEARAIIEAYEAGGGLTNKSYFSSDSDGRRWIELPFAYQPFWDAKTSAEAGEPQVRMVP